MTKAIRLLPITVAAALSLAACGKHDDGNTNAVAGEELSNEQLVPAGELGDANAATIGGNFGDANATVATDEVLPDNAASPGNGV